MTNGTNGTQGPETLTLLGVVLQFARRVQKKSGIYAHSSNRAADPKLMPYWSSPLTPILKSCALIRIRA